MRPTGKSNEYTLKQAIEELLKTYRLEGKVNEVKVVNSWEKVMGPVIAKYTSKIYMDGKTLVVVLQSAALREELTFGKERIIELMNEAAGGNYIDDLVLR